MAIQWNENVPSGTSLAGNAPSQFRSVWTSVAIGLGLQGDLLWAGSGGASDASAGYFKLGGSRAFYDVRSNSSVPAASLYTGCAFLASDTSQLFVYESAAAQQLGGTPFLIEFGPSVSTNSFVLRQSSAFAVASGATTTISHVTFPIAFSPLPTLVVQTSSDSRYLLSQAVLDGSGFSSIFSWFAGGTQSAFTIEWMAIGFGTLGDE